MRSAPICLGAEVVDSELEQGSQDGGVAPLAAGGDGVDPRGDRRLAMPVEAVGAEHPEVAHDANGAGGMALDERRPERLGEHDDVALGAGGPIEHDPLVVAAGAPQQPARQPVGEPAGGIEWLASDRLPNDGELRLLRPLVRIRRRVHDRSTAGDPALVHDGPERMIDLLDQEVVEERVGCLRQAALGELLGQASQPSTRRAHRGHARSPSGDPCSGMGELRGVVDEEHEVVGVAVPPVLARFVRLDERMVIGAEVGRRVAVGRAVAAARHARTTCRGAGAPTGRPCEGSPRSRRCSVSHR